MTKARNAESMDVVAWIMALLGLEGGQDWA